MQSFAFRIPQRIIFLAVMIFAFLCGGCVVGPDYKRPAVQAPTKFKEERKGWKLAKPKDACNRGEWWKVFHDPQLNALEDQLNKSNQNIANAAANYEQAVALVGEARAAYFPVVTSALSLQRQKQGSSGSASVNSTTITTGSTSPSTDAGGSSTTTASSSSSLSRGQGNPNTNHSLLLNASWEPDIWGAVRRSVEASAAGAQASAALMALTRLMAQASLAQYYFEIKGVDVDQKILDDTVKDNNNIYSFTKNQYTAGVAAQADTVQARTQLETAQGLAINNGINRAIYEHAIAVLIGVPPANFSLPKNIQHVRAPTIPLVLPSELLERRPDIAQAERLMAEANAQIGVAVAAWFPSLNLFTTGNITNPGFANIISLPALSWTIGGQLAETLYDGGLRNSTIEADKAAYRANVASYRQIVLAGFQDVEDNLASLRILKQQLVVQDQAAADAKLALKLVVNQYKAGTANYSNVLTAQITAYSAERTAADVRYLSMSSAVGLIRALGGGWDAVVLDKAVG
jgi:NodT family efflux transporter outer membrane factor (OMF) lipoprotein